MWEKQWKHVLKKVEKEINVAIIFTIIIQSTLNYWRTFKQSLSKL